jgi:hypothetical protein
MLGSSVSTFTASPSVVCTLEVANGELTMMVLWRGKPGWSWSTTPSGVPQVSYQMGNDGFTVHLNYGAVSLTAAVDRLTHRVQIGQTMLTFPEGSNVVMLDGVGQADGPRLINALRFDPSGVSLDPRALDLPSVLARSPEVVSFLQCDKGTGDAVVDKALRLRVCDKLQPTRGRGLVIESAERYGR